MGKRVSGNLLNVKHAHSNREIKSLLYIKHRFKHILKHRNGISTVIKCLGRLFGGEKVKKALL